MQMIDQHLHIDSRSLEELALMSMAGIKAVVSHVYYPHQNVKITSSTYFDYYDRKINWEPARTKKEFIETYLGVGINMVDVPMDWEKVLEALPKYLAEERVVCIGEIGLEPTSETADLSLQEEILKEELKIAKVHSIPVNFHTPPTEKEKWVEKYASLIQDAKLDKDKVTIDHANPSMVEFIWEMGFYAGITIQQWRNVTPFDAAEVLAKGENLDRLMLDSDSSPKLSDALSVPKAVHEARKLGVKDEDIKKVVWDNPIRFYNLPG
jgi:predicted metal-dependent TIM-barrel fold hydrolase